MFGTDTTFALFLAIIPFAVWACATWDSNPRPERFGVNGLAECTTQLLHIQQPTMESFQCENEHTKA